MALKSKVRLGNLNQSPKKLSSVARNTNTFESRALNSELRFVALVERLNFQFALSAMEACKIRELTGLGSEIPDHYELAASNCFHCLFWAGTSRKKACDKHGDRVRKANNRRDIKQRKTVAATKRRKQKATETFDQMNRTAQSVIRAIMSGSRKFTTIDGYSWRDFNDDDLLPRSTLVVRRVTHKPYKDGFLTYHESADRRDRYGFSPNDYYYPTPKLTELWNDKTARIPKQS